MEANPTDCEDATVMELSTVNVCIQVNDLLLFDWEDCHMNYFRAKSNCAVAV